MFDKLGRPKYFKLAPVMLSRLVGSGPRPYSPRQLVDLNFKQSVSLQRGWYETFTQSEYEEELARMEKTRAFMGLKLFGVPLSDFWRPEKNSLISVFALIFSSNEPTYFHCLHGKDRTGYVRALYRMIVQRWSEDMARAELRKLGFHFFPYFFWLDNLKADADYLAARFEREIKHHRTLVI